MQVMSTSTVVGTSISENSARPEGASPSSARNRSRARCSRRWFRRRPSLRRARMARTWSRLWRPGLRHLRVSLLGPQAHPRLLRGGRRPRAWRPVEGGVCAPDRTSGSI